MTKTEMLTKLRILLSDAQEVGYPEDSELLDYLDRATVYYSEQMIAVKDPSMLKKMDVVGCLTKTPYGATQIDLPEFFTPYLSSATANLLRGETEAAVNKLQEAVYFSNMNKRGIIPDPVMWGG